MKILRGLFLFVFLTACQSSFIADVVTQSGQALYHDDFSDTGSGWPQMTSSIGTLEYANGTYRMLVLTPGYDLRAVSGHRYGDARVEVDATRLSGPVYNRFGLTCRFQDINDFYFFVISSDGYYAIGEIKNGATSLIGQEMMAYNSIIQQGGGANHLRFDCIGNTLRGYVNGQAIAITEDANFSGGDAGLISGAFDEGNVEVSFDNFVVYKP
ncbi:MAG TPA: hypothetical protein VF359_01730 [Anaerolineales bacterium]